MQGRNPVDRSNLVQCIGCKGWVTPDERLRAAFVGGHNVRFFVCLECIREYKQKKFCRVCGGVMNGKNIGLERVKGKRMIKRGTCLDCWGDYVIRRRLYGRLVTDFPTILK